MAMRDTGLVDYLGRPIKKQELTREIAAPTLAGVRQIWDESVASGLTPVRLASLLRDAATGDHAAYLTLAEEMEERDLHYGAEISKRKLAVSRLPITVESASDDQKDKDLAEEVRKLTRKAGFRMLLKDLLDGLGKGYSVAEIDWQRGSQWIPRAYTWRDPHFFQFDRIKRSEIRLRDEQDSFNGLELAPFKFICHVPKIKSGIPIRGGLARVAAWAYMCKGYTVKDWLAFAEVFGMPFRVGKYGSNANEDDINVLRRAVANIGSDAAAVIPESMLVEFIESGGKQGSAEFFKTLAQYLDDQVSKGILGQTASSSGTPGKLGNEELQGEVRDDIRDDDAEQLAETINRDLVKPFIDLNFGPQEEYPSVSIAQPDSEDVTTLINALDKLVPLGLRVEQSVIRDKIGIPDPAEDAKPEDLLTVPVAAPQEQIPDLKSQISNRQQAGGKALNSEQKTKDLADLLTDDLALRTRATGDQWINTIKALFDQAESLEDFRDRVMALASGDNLDPAEMGELIAQAMAIATMTGMAEVVDEQ